MGYSKRQFVTAAFEELGLAAYVFDLQPHDLQMALRRLDSMIAEWNARGIRIGFPIPTSPENSDLDEASEVPDSANEAIITNLALRIAPSFGKTPQPETKVAAKSSYGVLLSRATHPIEQQYPGTLPSGAGNKPWRVQDDPFVRRPVDPILVGTDGHLELY